jgi:hypothetical protein
MDFFFRNKTIVVDAFTHVTAVAESAPLQLAANFIPDWWKSIKASGVKVNDMENILQPTMKGCTGFLNLYKRGFIVPLWADLELDILENGNYRFISPLTNFNMSSHGSYQYNNSFPNEAHLKLEAPWIIKEKSGVEFYLGGAFWNQQSTINGMNICPGIASLDRSMQVNINCFFKKEEKRYSLLAGYPLAHIIPLSEKPLQVRSHLISESEFSKRANTFYYRSNFINDAIKRTRASLRNKYRCPFR